MEYYNDYLMHYGVKGMKWGVRKRIGQAVKNRKERLKKDYLEKERKLLIDDAKSVTAKAHPGQKTMQVVSNAPRKRTDPKGVVSHIVDEHGNVKLSAIRGMYGNHFVAAGKKYVNKNNLITKYYRTGGYKNIIEYDVYR